MENQPFKMLVANVDTGMYVTTGNLPVNETTGVPILALGQLGVFNADNNKSCNTALSDGTSTATRIYFGVGVDTDGDGVVDEVKKSNIIVVGSESNVKNQSNYVAHVAQVQKLSWTITKCNTEYLVKVRLQGGILDEFLGFHNLNKTYSVTTPCCTDCNADCDEDTYSCDKLADLLVAEFNNDPDELFTAAKVTTNDFAAFTVAATSAAIAIDIRPYSDTATANVTQLGAFATTETAELKQAIENVLAAEELGGEVSVTESGGNFTITVTNSNAARVGIAGGANTGAAATAASAAIVSPSAVDQCPGITLTMNELAIANFCRIPVNMVYASNVVAKITGDVGFSCNFNVQEQVAPVYSHGKGVIVKSLEEEAIGFDGETSQFRFTGLIQPDPTVNLTASVSNNYDIFSLETEDIHRSTSSGKAVYRQPHKTIIAVKTGGTSTTNLATVFGNL